MCVVCGEKASVSSRGISWARSFRSTSSSSLFLPAYFSLSHTHHLLLHLETAMLFLSPAVPPICPPPFWSQNGCVTRRFLLLTVMLCGARRNAARFPGMSKFFFFFCLPTLQITHHASHSFHSVVLLCTVVTEKSSST